MDAVIFRGPYNITVERRPKPVIREATDAVVKVTAAGICGSELHMYRGVQESAAGHIMGHEMVGIVEEVGDNVTGVKPGDRVVGIFSPACMSCWYCIRGHTSRCVHGKAFGTQALEGSQAQYVRIPFADGTLYHAPDLMDDRLLLMMCDIYPTGYYGASRAIDGFAKAQQYEPKYAPVKANGHSNGISNGAVKSVSNAQETEFQEQSLYDAVFVVIGCGPVGLCAILTAKAKGVRTLYAVDSVEDRLADAQKFGAIPLNLTKDDIQNIITEVTDGRGADAVIEVVGNRAALRSAFDLLRPCGHLSSIGFNQGDVPWTALEAYGKNLTVNFGRAPVRAVFRESLEYLQKCRDQVAGFISHELPLLEAARGYALFDKQQAKKVMLRPGP